MITLIKVVTVVYLLGYQVRTDNRVQFLCMAFALCYQILNFLFFA